MLNSDPYTYRALSENDRSVYLAHCLKHPDDMLPARMNIEAFGMSGSKVHAWGAFHKYTQEMAGILIRYSNTILAVDEDGSCARGFARILDEERNIAGIRGTTAVLTGIQALLRRYQPTDWEVSQFMILRKQISLGSETMRLARLALPGDINLLSELYRGAGVMYRSRSSIAEKVAEGRIWVVQEPELGRRLTRIAACALLNVEGNDAALIGGVYTMPEARGKGYASACTAALSVQLQQNGINPCLFYENPAAGRVYSRLGFQHTGKWALLYVTSE